MMLAVPPEEPPPAGRRALMASYSACRSSSSAPARSTKSTASLRAVPGAGAVGRDDKQRCQAGCLGALAATQAEAPQAHPPSSVSMQPAWDTRWLRAKPGGGGWVWVRVGAGMCRFTEQAAARIDTTASHSRARVPPAAARPFVCVCPPAHSQA